MHSKCIHEVLCLKCIRHKQHFHDRSITTILYIVVTLASQESIVWHCIHAQSCDTVPKILFHTFSA